MTDTFIPRVKKFAALLLYLMLIVVVVSMCFGSLHLVSIVIEKVISPDPYIGLLNILDLMDIFSMLLTIVVGYELFKSISIIIKSDIIPAGPILKIAAIAVANKIITMDLKNIDYSKIISLGVLIITLAAGYYFFTKSDQEVNGSNMG